MALRLVKPGVAHLVTPFLLQHPDLLQLMPNETPAARIWMTVVACNRVATMPTSAGGLPVMSRRYREGFSRSTTRSAIYWIGSAPTRERAAVRDAAFHPLDGA